MVNIVDLLPEKTQESIRRRPSIVSSLPESTQERIREVDKARARSGGSGSSLQTSTKTQSTLADAKAAEEAKQIAEAARASGRDPSILDFVKTRREAEVAQRVKEDPALSELFAAQGGVKSGTLAPEDRPSKKTFVEAVKTNFAKQEQKIRRTRPARAIARVGTKLTERRSRGAVIAGGALKFVGEEPLKSTIIVTSAPAIVTTLGALGTAGTVLGVGASGAFIVQSIKEIESKPTVREKDVAFGKVLAEAGLFTLGAKAGSAVKVLTGAKLSPRLTKRIGFAAQETAKLQQVKIAQFEGYKDVLVQTKTVQAKGGITIKTEQVSILRGDKVTEGRVESVVFRKGKEIPLAKQVATFRGLTAKARFKVQLDFIAEGLPKKKVTIEAYRGAVAQLKGFTSKGIKEVTAGAVGTQPDPKGEFGFLTFGKRTGKISLSGVGTGKLIEAPIPPQAILGNRLQAGFARELVEGPLPSTKPQRIITPEGVTDKLPKIETPSTTPKDLQLTTKTVQLSQSQQISGRVGAVTEAALKLRDVSLPTQKLSARFAVISSSSLKQTSLKKSATKQKSITETLNLKSQVTKEASAVTQISRLDQGQLKEKKLKTVKATTPVPPTPIFDIGKPKEPPKIPSIKPFRAQETKIGKGVGVVETREGKRLGVTKTARGAVTRGVGTGLKEFVVRGTGAIPTVKGFKTKPIKTGTLFRRRKKKR